MNSGSLHVWIAADRFLPESTGWIQQVDRIARAIPRGRMRFSVVTRRPPVDVPPVDEVGPFRVVRLPPESGPSRLAPQLAFAARAGCLLLRKRRDIDVLFLPFTFFPAVLFMWAGRLLHVPVVSRISGREVDPIDSLPARLRHRTLRHVDAVIALNRWQRKRLREIGLRDCRIRLIGNGVDAESFRPASVEERRTARERWSLPQRGFVILFIGILCRRKGVAELLEAFQMVRAGSSEDLFASMRLVLAGPLTDVREGEEVYARNLEAAVERLSPSVVLTGEIDDVADLLRTADVFVLPSHREGMPNALLEAMASGVACVATDIPGSRDLIDHGRNGLLTPVGEAAELASAIGQLLRDDKMRERMGRAGRETVEEGHAVHSVAGRYSALFEEVARP